MLLKCTVPLMVYRTVGFLQRVSADHDININSFLTATNGAFTFAESFRSS